MAVNGTLGSLLNDGDSMDRAVFIFVFVGMGLDVVVLGFLFMFGFSKRIHILVSLVFNKIRKTFKMTHLTKAQIVEKYMKEAVMRQEFLGMLRDFKGSLFIFLVIMGGTFYMYLCLFLSMEMINDDHRYHVSFMHIFSAMNVANSANKFIPSPSGQGTMDLCLIHLLRASDAFSLTSNGIVPANDPYTENLIKGSTLL
jgi:uncharacterized membrane protein YbhN (UPF0104 family)